MLAVLGLPQEKKMGLGNRKEEENTKGKAEKIILNSIPWKTQSCSAWFKIKLSLKLNFFLKIELKC